MPASRPLFLAVPDPDPAVSRCRLAAVRACSRAGCSASSPRAGMPLASFSTVIGRRGGLLLLRRTPAARLGGGNVEVRAPSVQTCWLRCTSATKTSFCVVQRPQKVRLLAVTAVDAHPRKPHPPGARPAHDVERMFALRHLLARGLGNPRPLATRRVLDPALRQIEPHVDRRVPLAVRQHPEHRDLTIVDLAQPPRPLPGDAHRTIALLGEAALVDDQRARRLAAQKSVRVPADLRHHRLVVPRRVADEMLKLLRAATLNHGGHRLERAVLRLRQSAQISARHRRVVAPAGAKEMADGGRGTSRTPRQSSPPTIRSAIIQAYGYLTNRKLHFASKSRINCETRESTRAIRVKSKGACRRSEPNNR